MRLRHGVTEDSTVIPAALLNFHPSLEEGFVSWFSACPGLWAPVVYQCVSGMCVVCVCVAYTACGMLRGGWRVCACAHSDL